MRHIYLNLKMVPVKLYILRKKTQNVNGSVIKKINVQDLLNYKIRLSSKFKIQFENEENLYFVDLKKTFQEYGDDPDYFKKLNEYLFNIVYDTKIIN